MNKLRSLFLFLAGICFSVHVLAQEVIYSPYDDFDINNGDFSVIGKVNNKLYTFRSSSAGFFLDVFNDSMEKAATVILDFFPKKIYEVKFINYPNKMIVLYQSQESNRVMQYAALLDDMGRLVKGPMKLDEAKYGLWGPNRTYFSSVWSENKKNIIVYGIETKGSEMKLEGKWIDDELNVLKRGVATYKGERDLTYGEEAIISNDGVLYLPIYTPIGSKNYTDNLWLMTASKDETKLTPYKIPLNDHYVGGMHMKMDNINKRIYIGGFFSEKKNGNYDGVVYTYFDVNSNSYQNYKNIAFEDKLRYESGDGSKKRAFNDYQVRQIIVKNDGGFVLVAEDYFVTMRNGYSPGFGYYSWYYPNMASSVREYHYGNILTMSYNAEGVRDWYTFIRKDQYSQEDGGIFSSYAVMNTGGAAGFMFNDFNSARSRIQLATIEPDGKMSMQSLQTERRDEPDWLPRSGKQVASREMVVPCLRKRQICFAKIVF